MPKKHTEDVPTLSDVGTDIKTTDSADYDIGGVIDTKDTLPFRSPVLNMYLTNNCNAGIRLGSSARFIGENSSGKSAIVLDTLANAVNCEHLNGYNLIYVDKEDGLSVDIEARYGKEAVDRIQIYDSDGGPQSIESLFHFIRKMCTEHPSIIVVDSIDSFVSQKLLDAKEKNDENLDAGKKVTEPPMMINARVLSEEWKVTNPIISKTRSVVLWISQTRVTMDPYAKDAKYNASAGSATKFFESFRFGIRQGKPIERIDKFGNTRIVGYETPIKILKNRSTGRTGFDTTLYLYTALGFVPQEEVFEFLTTQAPLIKKAGAYYSADWLIGDTKMYKNDIIKLLYRDKDKYTLALNTMKQAWEEINKSIRDSLF